jgi:flagellar biosynthesis/type III secretory pathway protein FliH
MSWSDPEPRPAFRAGLSLVSSFKRGGEAEPTIIDSLPFGKQGDQIKNAGQPPEQPAARPNFSGLGQNLGQGLGKGLGQNLGRLLEQHFEQLGQAAPAAAPETPRGKVRPMVFSSFGGDAEDVEDPTDDVPVVEVVEPAEPLPPPPDFEAIKAEAWSEGFQHGYEEGKRLAAEEQRDATIRLGALLHDIVADNEGFVRGMESDIVELVLGIAEKIVGREVRTDPQIVVNVVRSALNEIHDATEVRIRAHPDDVTILEPRWQEMLPRRVAERSELIADELVERGGVVIETQIGYVDSQIKTRLQQVINTFQAVLDGEPV